MPRSAASELIEFLQSQLIAVVATVTPGGQPQGAAIFFWLDEIHGDKFSLFFITKRNSRKFCNLVGHPKMAMVIGSTIKPTTVQIDGTATLLDMDQGLKNLRGFKKMMNRHGLQGRVYEGEMYPSNPFQADQNEVYALFRVKPTAIKMMTYDKKNRQIVYRQLA